MWNVRLTVLPDLLYKIEFKITASLCLNRVSLTVQRKRTVLVHEKYVWIILKLNSTKQDPVAWITQWLALDARNLMLTVCGMFERSPKVAGQLISPFNMGSGHEHSTLPARFHPPSKIGGAHLTFNLCNTISTLKISKHDFQKW